MHSDPRPAVPGVFEYSVDRMESSFDKRDFFAWCDGKGLTKPDVIARYFRLSGQTIRNWRKDADSGVPERLSLAFWVRLAVAYYDSVAADDGSIHPSPLPSMTFAGLNEWRRRHGLETYEACGDPFRIKRQAVHLWQKRQRIPEWVALGCAGYDVWVKNKNSRGE